MKCDVCGFPLSGEAICPGCGKVLTEQIDELIFDANDLKPNKEIINGIERIDFNENEDGLSNTQVINMIVDQPISLETDKVDNEKKDYVEELVIDDPKVSDSEKIRNFSYQNMKLPLMLLTSVMIILGCLSSYFLLSNNPKTVFMNSVNDLFSVSKKSLNQDYNTLKTDIAIKVNASFNGENLINNLNIKLDGAVDYTNKIFDLNLNSSYDNKKLLNAKLYAENNSMYVYLEDIFSKYIKLPLSSEGMDNLFRYNNSAKEGKVVIESLEKAIDKALKKEYFEKDRAKVTVNGKEIKTLKSTLVLNGENVKKISKDFFTTLKEDEKFITNYSKMVAITEDELKNQIDKLMENIEKEEVNNALVRISLYTKGINKQFVKLDIVSTQDSENSDFSLVKIDKNNYEYTVTNNGESYNGTLVITAKDGENTSINLTARKGNDTIALAIDYGVKYDVNVSKVNVGKSVNFDDLTNEDFMEMITNLSKNEFFQSILMLLLGNSNVLSETSAVDTAYGVLKAGEFVYAEQLLGNSEGMTEPVIFTFSENGIVSNPEGFELNLNGTLPSGGTLNIAIDGEVNISNLIINEYTCNSSNGSVSCT